MTTPSSIEERIARLEGSFEQIERRLGTLEQDIRAGFERLESRINRVEERIDRVETKIETRFYWLVGIMLGVLIPMWVTIILAILLRG